MNWLALLATVSCLAAAGCGDDDEESSGQPETTASSASPAQTCVDSWNSDANRAHQATVATAVSDEVGLSSEGLRVGTWPESERTVPVWTPKDAFAESTEPASGKSTIATGTCLIVFPPNPDGAPAFFEAEGEWQLVRGDAGTSKFPSAAWRGIADVEEASADALGKLTLK